MKQIIMLKGLPGSGKTTWAKETLAERPGVYRRINKDELRQMLHAGHWTPANEKYVLKLRDKLVVDALEDGKHVIVDDTNLHPKHATRLGQLAEQHGAEFKILDFAVPLEDCIANDLKRPNSVGAAVIRKMHKQFVRKAPPKIEYDPEKEDAIICDIDGTICHIGDRDVYDASKCHLDTVNEPVTKVLHAFKGTVEQPGPRVIMVSGRDNGCRKETQQWLSDHSIGYEDLFMRPDGDKRKDSIVKREIYEREIKPKYNVLFVLDDRDQVVEMWREQGLTCLQVAEGDF